MAFESIDDAFESGVLNRWQGSVDPPYVSTEENFAGFGHDEIYAKVQAMQPVGLGQLADRWKQAGKNVDDLFTNFTAALRNAMSGWSGASREAAQASAAALAVSGEDLSDVARRVQPRLDEIADVASKLQSRIQPPGPDPAATSTPGLGRWDQAFEQIAAVIAARDEAVREMTALYSPTFRPGTGVGNDVPALGIPVDPAPGFNDLGSQTSSVSSNTSSGTPAEFASSPITVDQPNAETAIDSTAAEQQTPIDDSTETAATQHNPQTSETERVSPTSLTPTLPSTVNDATRYSTDTNTPGTRSNMPVTQIPDAQTPVVQSPTVQSPATVQNPTVQQANSARTAATRTAGSGMYPGAGAGKRNNEDSEHKLPSYLISDENGRELFGELPKTAPPVFGVWDERA